MGDFLGFQGRLIAGLVLAGAVSLASVARADEVDSGAAAVLVQPIPAPSMAKPSEHRAPAPTQGVLPRRAAAARIIVTPSRDAASDVAPPQLPEVVVTFDAPADKVLLPPPELPDVVVTMPPPGPRPLALPRVPPAPTARAAAPISAPAPANPQPRAAMPPGLPAAPVALAPASPPSANPLALTQLTREDLRAAAEAFLRADLPQGLRANQQAQQPRKEREALAAFYATRDYAPLWIADGGWSPAAKLALKRLALAAEDGLDLVPYAVPNPDSASPTSLAQAELRLSEAVAAYARQASGSRVDPARLSLLISARPTVPEVGQALAAIAASADAGAALLAYNPPHQGYRNLRAKLQEVREARQSTLAAASPIPAGPALRIGMQDARVPLLRARFGLAPVGDEFVYDAQVAAAIADFQRANSLPANGALTPRTVAALGGGEPARLENEILSNMERWRWMPRDMGANRIEVNIPDYTVTVFRDNGVLHRARVVVGKPDTPTPVFSETMQYLIVNPSWNVPQSIIQKEMLPRLAADPDYLARQGYEVAQRGDTLVVRQPPGERNALGRIKFMFPNQHAVYLHDTPSRALFANERRAFSHGCVRVDQPFKLAEVLLGREHGWSEERVRAMVGGAERTIYLPRPLPIHIMYFTAAADEAGNVQLKEDIYGYSRRVKAALGLEGEAWVEAPRRAAKSTSLHIKPKAHVARRAPAHAAPAPAPLTIAPAAQAAADPAPRKSMFGWIFGQ